MPLRTLVLVLFLLAAIVYADVDSGRNLLSVADNVDAVLHFGQAPSWGSECSQNSHCQDGLVCLDGKCSYCDTNEQCSPMDFDLLFWKEPSCMTLGGVRGTCKVQSPTWYFIRAGVAGLVIFLASTAASSSGTGGGGIFVPSLIIFYALAAKDAIPLSKSTILASTIAALFSTQIWASNPANRRQHLIHYDTAATLGPTVLAGTVLGVTFNILIPGYVLLICLCLILALISVRSIQKAWKVYKKETKAMTVEVDGSKVRGLTLPELEPLQGELKRIEASLIWGIIKLFRPTQESVLLSLKARQIPLVALIAMISGICWLVLTTLLKGGDGAPSIIGIRMCSLYFWLIFFSVFPPLLTISGCMACRVMAKRHAILTLQIWAASRNNDELALANAFVAKRTAMAVQKLEAEATLQGLDPTFTESLAKQSSIREHLLGGVQEDQDPVEYRKEVGNDPQKPVILPKPLSEPDDELDPTIGALGARDEHLGMNVGNYETFHSTASTETPEELTERLVYLLEYKEQPPFWTVSSLILCLVASFGGGIVAGMLGIGAGVFQQPLLVEVGFSPAVAAATSQAMVLFTATSTTVQFFVAGRLRLFDVLWFGSCGLAGAILGTVVVNRIVVKLRKQFFICLLLAFVLVLSAFMLFIVGAVSTVDQYVSGTLTQTGAFCPN